MEKITSKNPSHGFYANIYWREHLLPRAGDKHKGHKHIIDHATVVMKGSMDVVIEGEDKFSVQAPCVIEIDKDKVHEFTALEDNTVYFCIFATNKLSETLQPMSDVKKEEFLKETLCSDCTGCPDK